MFRLPSHSPIVLKKPVSTSFSHRGHLVRRADEIRFQGHEAEPKPEKQEAIEQVFQEIVKTVEKKNGFWEKARATRDLVNMAGLACLTAWLEERESTKQTGKKPGSHETITPVGSYLFEQPASYPHAIKALAEIPKANFARRLSLYQTFAGLGSFARRLHEVTESPEEFNQLHVQWLGPMTYVVGNLSEENIILAPMLGLATNEFKRLPKGVWDALLLSHAESVPLNQQYRLWDAFKVPTQNRISLLTSLFEKSSDETFQASVIEGLHSLRQAVSASEQQQLASWLDSKGYGPDFIRKPTRRRDEEIPLSLIPSSNPTNAKDVIDTPSILKQQITHYIHHNFRDSASHQVFTFFCPDEAGREEVLAVIYTLAERAKRPVIQLSGNNNPQLMKVFEETRLLQSGKPATIVIKLPPAHPQANALCARLSAIYNHPVETVAHQKISSAEHTIFLITHTTKEQLKHNALVATRNIEGITSLLSRASHYTLQQAAPAQTDEQSKKRQ